MAVDVGSAVGYLDLDITGFLSGLKSAQNEADKSSKTMAEKIGGNLTSAGKSLTSAGSSLTKTVTLPIVGAGAAVVKLSSDFEAGMSKVSAISGATGGDLDRLKEKAKEMGAKTKFSASESADAFTYMAMAGWKTEDMLQGIEGIMSLAAADGLDLATTSDIVTDALTAFGLSAGDSGHFADVLAKAASNANTNVSMLGESFKYVAPVAGALGYSAEDTAIALGLMANSGIKASQAGTTLRSALTRMVSPTDDAISVMKQYGITMTNSDGSMKSLITVMGDLRTSLGGLSEAEQTQAASALFGKQAMSGMLSIINASDGDFDKLAEQIYNADGAAKQMSETMIDNLSGQITILKSSLEGLALQFGEIILPYLKQFVAKIQDLVLKFQALSPQQKEQIVKWAAIAAAIGPLLLVVGKFTTSIGGMITTFSKVPGAITKFKGSMDVASKAFTTFKLNIGEGFTLAKSGFSGLATQAGGLGTKIGAMAAGITGPMLAIAAVVAIVVAAFASLWKNNEEFREKIMAIWNQIKETFDNFTQGIVDRLNSLGFNFSSITDVIKSIWEGFCNFLAPIFEYVFQQVANAFKFVTDSILNILDFWIAIFKGDWSGAWDAIKAQFENIWNLIKSTFENVLNMMKGILDVVLGWFGTSWDNCWNSIKTFFVNIWNGIVSFFTTTWDTIKSIVKVGIQIIVDLLKLAFDLITLPFRFIWENCKDTIIKIWDSIKDKINTALNTIKSIVTTVFNAIKSVITTIWNGIKTAIETVVNAIKTVVQNVFNAIKTAVTTVWNAIKTAIETPLNAAKTKVTNIINSIKSVFTSGFNAAKNVVANIFDSIKDKISSVMDGAKNIVSNAVNKLKSLFNFNWSLPKLKLPHFKVTGKFSLNPLSVPSFGIEWYKKAMGNGMILNGATIFGMDSKGNLLGGGEAGSETVVGTASLMSMIREAVNSTIEPLISVGRELAMASAELGYVTYDGFTKVKETFDKDNKKAYEKQEGGDTYIFNSPKPIDEIEAAKQMKKTKRELAEGF